MLFIFDQHSNVSQLGLHSFSRHFYTTETRSEYHKKQYSGHLWFPISLVEEADLSPDPIRPWMHTCKMQNEKDM